MTKVTAINNAVEYCDPAADGCTLSGDWPFLAFSSTSTTINDVTETVVDILGRETDIRFDASNRLRGVNRPGECSEGMAVEYNGNSRVQKVIHQGTQERYYFWSFGTGGELISTSDEALARKRVVTTAPNGLIESSKIALDVSGTNYAETTYTCDSEDRLYEVITPAGIKVRYIRDDRGQVTDTVVAAMPIRQRSHLERTARLRYLAPDIVMDILDGSQPAHLSARKLVRAASLLLESAAQRRILLVS